MRGINYSSAGTAPEEVEGTTEAHAGEAEPVALELAGAEVEPTEPEAVATGAEAPTAEAPAPTAASVLREADLGAALAGCGDAAPAELAACLGRELVARGYEVQSATEAPAAGAVGTEAASACPNRPRPRYASRPWRNRSRSGSRATSGGRGAGGGPGWDGRPGGGRGQGTGRRAGPDRCQVRWLSGQCPLPRDAARRRQAR